MDPKSMKKMQNVIIDWQTVYKNETDKEVFETRPSRFGDGEVDYTFTNAYVIWLQNKLNGMGN